VAALGGAVYVVESAYPTLKKLRPTLATARKNEKARDKKRESEGENDIKTSGTTVEWFP
jgi:hypothetical protein